MARKTIDPVIVVLFLALCLSVIWIYFLPVDFPEEENLLARHEWKDCADVVIMGTSRVEWVLDPADFEKELPGYRINNFGFAGVQLKGDYLKSSDRVLDKSTGKAVVLIALDAFNVNEESENNLRMFQGGRRQYKKLLKRGGKVTVELTEEQEQHNALAPRGFCNFLGNLCPIRTKKAVGNNGANIHWRVPADPNFMLPYYHMWLSVETAGYDPAFLDEFFARIKAWREEGVRVFAYSSPPSERLRRLFTDFGFDDALVGIKKRFIEAGGEWIEVPEEMDTFDGQHLTPAAAQELTKMLLTELTAKLPKGPSNANTERCLWKHVTKVTES